MTEPNNTVKLNRIAAGARFVERILNRLANRNILNTPYGTVYRDIDIDDNEVGKLLEKLEKLYADIQEIVEEGGTETATDLEYDIMYMIIGLRMYAGLDE